MNELDRIKELLPTSLYAGSKDWEQGSTLERVEWLLSMYESAAKEIERLEKSVEELPVLWGVRDAGGKFSPYAHWAKKDAERIASASHAGAVAAPLYANPPRNS